MILFRALLAHLLHTDTDTNMQTHTHTHTHTHAPWTIIFRALLAPM